MKFILTISFLLLLTCGTVANAANYNISGRMTGFKDDDKVYLLDKDSETTLDSAALIKGQFSFKGRLKYGPMYLTVTIKEGRNKYELLVFAGGGKISISGDKTNFPYDVSIIGPPEQSKYNSYVAMLKSLSISADQAWQLYTKAKGDSKTKAGMAYNAIIDQKSKLAKKWIFNNIDSYFAENELCNYLPEFNTDTIKTFYAALAPDLKQSIYGKRISVFLTKGDTLKIKDRYIDFEAYDASGKKLKLSDFNKKYILLDFSSIACGPCIQSIGEIRTLSKKYSEQLNIVTYTLDKRADWLEQIKKDHITWYTVINPGGEFSKAMLKYNVISIPTFYLISPNGIIVDKWTAYEKLTDTPGYIEKHLLKFMK